MPHETESPLKVRNEDDVVLSISFQDTIPDILHKNVFIQNHDHVQQFSPKTMLQLHKDLFPSATLIKDAAHGLSYIVKK